VLTVYLAALIFGLGLFAVQMFFSSSDADHPGAHLGDAGGHALTDSDVHATSHGDWASIFTSLRFYMFAAIAFGVVGAPVTWLGLGAPGLTLMASLGTAAVVGAAAALGFRLLGRQTLSSGAAAPELVGHVGRVLLACEKGRRGKVRLNVRGQIIDFIATTEEERLAPGAAVIVQEVHAERLVVCAAPIELLPE
jgi:membrane protein implicated in regulation of membrane protease activity